MSEKWEDLQARLVRLGEFAEDLPEFVADPALNTWLYKEICREASTVWDTSMSYWMDTLHARLDRALAESEQGTGDGCDVP
ncbi:MULTISPECIES: hypothetical protein [unclassified Crossiella]|uniref:hypothetical protein n=1 Tax=unclassified Crossiella TaxID=2620835 RepID=UPI001FFF44D3|nr:MULTISPECIES: hypothetical protein [unclassified Crossiella]MCK2241225.1 hypothetical protein [Crossiella sp. S99.2]MCK2253631.1 hypothetical protein [Crossiella sp. S99.1]